MKRLGNMLVLLVLVMYSSVAFAQSNVINGKVRTGSSASLGKLSVTVKGTQSGTTTDENGNFALSVPSNTKYPFTLVISGVGIATQEVVVKSVTDVIDVDVIGTSTLSEEIVVSATRTQTRALESPVTIERIGINALRQAPAASYWQR
jgi:hypothetical protein